MNVGCRLGAALLGSLSLLWSLALADWTQLNSGTGDDLRAVHFPTGTRVGYAVGVGADTLGGEVGVILKTTDGGATWVSQASGVAGPLNSVYFVNDNTGYAVGAAGAAIKTSDGGATWNPMTVGVNDALTSVQFPGNGLIGYIGAHPATQNKRVLKTANGGSTWDSIAVGGAMSWSYSCGMATDNIGVVIGKQGMVYGTANGFSSSSAQGPQTNADMVAAAFSPTDANVGYLIGNDSLGGLIRHTSTGGASLWDSVSCWYVSAFRGIDVPTSTAAYACGDSFGTGIILRSISETDFYKTTISSVAPGINSVCFPVGEDTGYACGGGGTILKTTDKGIPWMPGVAEGKAPSVVRTGIRVVSNPGHYGITLQSDAAVNVSVFDASGRVVLSQAANKGTNFLRLPTGAYFVKAGNSTARAVVTD